MNFQNHFKKILIYVIYKLPIYLIPVLGFGQDMDNENDLKQIIGYPLNGIELRLDGIVDEEFWTTIPANGNFSMQEPKEGAKPTEQTEIRIAFDSQNIYIAVVCYDSSPSDI